MSKFSEYFTIRGYDINAAYQITPAALCGYFQESFARYCTMKNLAAFDIIPDNLLWVVSDIHIEFKNQMPFWCEKIRTELWVSEIKKLRMYLDFRIYSGDILVAQGDSCWFTIDSNTRKPLAIEEFAKKFGFEDEKVFGVHERVILTEKGTLENKRIHKVGLSDLDFNYHVNNLAYVNIALSGVNERYIKENSLQSYLVTYYKESFLHDELEVQLYRDNNSFIHKFVRQSDGEVVCIIQTNWQKKIADTRDVRNANFDLEKQERAAVCVL